MNIQEFAKMLNGREYGSEITKEEVRQAEELGFVVVFGYSDDNMELRGAINEEFGCYEGGIVAINENGIVEECDCNCTHYKEALNHSTKIESCWWNDGDYTWTYETNIPHEKFDVLEDGEKWCQGIVFNVKDL